MSQDTQKHVYKAKIRKIEDKVINTEKIEDQEVYILAAEDAQGAYTKFRLVTDTPILLKAGSHITVTLEYDKVATELAERNLTVSKDQQTLDAESPVARKQSSEQKTMEDDLKSQKEKNNEKMEKLKSASPGKRVAIKRK